MSLHWTEYIEEEFLRNAQDLYKVTEAIAGRRLLAMKMVCPEWEIPIPMMSLKEVPKEVDKKDRHVAAAALAIRRSNDESTNPFDVIIVTDNIKDFAIRQMADLGVRIMKSGQFLNLAYLSEPYAVEAAIDQAVKDLKAPPYTLAELLFALGEHGAEVLVEKMSANRGIKPVKKKKMKT